MRHLISIAASFVSHFEPHGCGISAMSTEIYSATTRPSSTHPTSSATTMTPSDNFEKTKSVQQNCWHQGVQAGRNFGFFADGFYHNLVILKRRPQRTRRGISGRSPRSHFVITRSPSISTRRISERRSTGRKNPWSAFVATITPKASIPSSHPRKSKNSGSTNSPRRRYTLQIRFRGSRLGRNRGRSDFQDAPDRSRVRPDGGYSMLDIEHFLCRHDEEHLVSDLAGLVVGEVRSPR